MDKYDEMHRIRMDSRNAAQTNVARDIRDKKYAENHPDRYDKGLFDKGQAWFESGLSLNDAPEEIKNNSNFINGFNRGSRKAVINKDLYNAGVEAFKSNVNLASVPEKYLNSEYFIRGYDDARRSIEPKR